MSSSDYSTSSLARETAAELPAGGASATTARSSATQRGAGGAAAGLPSPRVALLAAVSRDDVAIKQATYRAPEGNSILRRHVAIVDALARGEA